MRFALDTTDNCAIILRPVKIWNYKFRVQWPPNARPEQNLGCCSNLTYEPVGNEVTNRFIFSLLETKPSMGSKTDLPPLFYELTRLIATKRRWK
jgi:hypothetical protein